jgi:hypothetical protein
LPWSPRSLVGAGPSNGTELEGAVVDVDPVSPATLRSYSSMLDRQSLVAGTSDATVLEGAAADAVSPAILQLYASLLDRTSLLAGAPEDPTSTPTWKAPGRETSWPEVERNVPWCPGSLHGGASDVTTLEGSLAEIVSPARLVPGSLLADGASDVTTLEGSVAEAVSPERTSTS